MMSVNGCKSCHKDTTNNETDALSALFNEQLAVLTCVKTHNLRYKIIYTTIQALKIESRKYSINGIENDWLPGNV